MLLTRFHAYSENRLNSQSSLKILWGSENPWTLSTALGWALQVFTAKKWWWIQGRFCWYEGFETRHRSCLLSSGPVSSTVAPDPLRWLGESPQDTPWQHLDTQPRPGAEGEEGVVSVRSQHALRTRDRGLRNTPGCHGCCAVWQHNSAWLNQWTFCNWFPG